MQYLPTIGGLKFFTEIESQHIILNNSTRVTKHVRIFIFDRASKWCFVCFWFYKRLKIPLEHSIVKKKSN